MRFLILLATCAIIGGALWVIYRTLASIVGAATQTEFVYVRFRDGVLVLKRKTKFKEEEVQFKPAQAFQDLGPKQIAAHAGGVTWFTFPDGYEVASGSKEEKAIARCLRFADNTGLLAAEILTE